jgi:hypothetical protein
VCRFFEINKNQFWLVIQPSLFKFIFSEAIFTKVSLCFSISNHFNLSSELPSILDTRSCLDFWTLIFNLFTLVLRCYFCNLYFEPSILTFYHHMEFSSLLKCDINSNNIKRRINGRIILNLPDLQFQICKVWRSYFNINIRQIQVGFNKKLIL